MRTNNNTINKAVQKKTEVINTQVLDRHRLSYGALPAMDIDLIEYKNDKPAIIFEFKHGEVVSIDLGDKQFTRIRNTANALKIPAFCAVYYFPGLNEVTNKVSAHEKRKYYVIPINGYAKTVINPKSLVTDNHMSILMTEKEFVEMIYRLKNQPMSEDLNLDDEIDIRPQLPLILNKQTVLGMPFKKVA